MFMLLIAVKNDLCKNLVKTNTYDDKPNKFPKTGADSASQIFKLH